MLDSAGTLLETVTKTRQSKNQDGSLDAFKVLPIQKTALVYKHQQSAETLYLIHYAT